MYFRGVVAVAFRGPYGPETGYDPRYTVAGIRSRVTPALGAHVCGQISSYHGRVTPHRYEDKEFEYARAELSSPR